MTEADGKSLIFDPYAAGAAQKSRIFHYQQWLESKQQTTFKDYHDLWRWSVDNLGEFWLSIADYFGVKLQGTFDRSSYPDQITGQAWFPGAKVNFAGHVLLRRDDKVAVIYQNEAGELRELSYQQLAEQVDALAAGLKALGVKRGDRVAAYLPNVPEAVVGFLATVKIGAIWSLCSPDFGAKIVVDRFKQIEPKVLIASSRYQYGGKRHDRSDTIAEVVSSIGSIETVILTGGEPISTMRSDVKAIDWFRALELTKSTIGTEQMNFDAPLWVVYTSGTTGLPKPIVHSHGGALLELCKLHGLHLDLGDEDRFFWYTSTGWIMWNLLIGGLLVGATVVLYDGNPNYPGPESLWRLVSDRQVTYFGAGAPFFQGAQKAELHPGMDFDVSRLRAVGSTGAPLPASTFEWIRDEVKNPIPIDSICGGTDVSTALVGSSRLLPLYAGEIQCRCLGVKAEAYDNDGKPVIGELGELVIEKPMPSMPLYFWNDKNDERYKESYFSRFPGVWSQGDWVRFQESGACIVYGRSDATLNRGGIRLGTSDFYDVVESIEWIDDSLVIDTSELDSEGQLILFVKTVGELELDTDRIAEINKLLTKSLSPRHRPDWIARIDQVPRTMTGKKLEVPVKKIMKGAKVDNVINRNAVDHPGILDHIAALRDKR